MTRPTHVEIDTAALLHNVQHVKKLAPGKQIIAMVKANAYGCGLSAVIPALANYVDGFGVACLAEALAVRKLYPQANCILFQGVFTPDELQQVALNDFQCVIHQAEQLQWLLNTPLKKPIKVWLKINTGMNRLGVSIDEAPDLLKALQQCSWVDKQIGLMSHFASADEPTSTQNQEQLNRFSRLSVNEDIKRSLANSAAIMAFPISHFDVVRPGIMLYGVSPFVERTGAELGLKPVMQLKSAITAIHHCEPGEKVGYGGTWECNGPAVIGVVAIGYGDGYPRHITPGTPVWIQGEYVPVVGRVSMDMLTVDLTDFPKVKLGDPVELWGKHLPVETIAKFAQTSPYELICQISPRGRREN